MTVVITYMIGDTCPWPQRRGLACGIVIPTPEQSKVYPFAGKAESEVVVYIPEDPLACGDSWWSCVMDRQHLMEVELSTQRLVWHLLESADELSPPTSNEVTANLITALLCCQDMTMSEIREAVALWKSVERT
jgi:hypothetical protein